ncbi:MAG: DNA alkylation repair protein, partial [Acidimicrobiia bacterium]|nr:DNA alkylation repair protein [Acidimicrobiia bacterium]
MAESDARVREAVAFVRRELAARADPDKAAAMQAYMKTDMPFHGVQKPERTVVFRELKRRCAPQTWDEYRALVTALWELPHREETY